MAKKTSLLSGLSNAKTRTFVILFGAIIIVGVAIAISRGKKADEDVISKQASQTVGVPSSIRATPGATVASPKYREIQIKENEERAQEAMKKKSSAIPTIIGAVSENPGDKGNADQLALEAALRRQQGDKGKFQLGGAEGGGFGAGGIGADGFGEGGAGGEFGAGGAGGRGGQGGEFGAGGFGKSERDREREAQEARLKEQRDRLEKQRADAERAKELERQRLLALQQQKEYEAAVQRVAAQMKASSSVLKTEWDRAPNQTYVQGALADKPFKGKSSSSSSSAGVIATDGVTRTPRVGIGRDGKPTIKRKVFIKAGTILFGVIDTAVDTDEPGPVLATVVAGKYSGGKLIGAFTHGPQQTAVTLNFNQMTVPKKIHSFGVSVVAIDPETARTAIATDYDRHLLQRYGTLFISSLAQGYGQAITQQGTTTVSPLTGTTTTSTPPLDNKEQLLAALGEVGKQVGAATKQYFNTPYTVTIDKGTSVGLLFLNDVDVTDEEG